MLASTMDNSDQTLPTTISYYDANAAEYAARYADVDLRDGRQTLLDLMPDDSRLILDLGCGPGRDLALFQATVIGIDLSAGLLREARQGTEAPLIRGDYRALPFKDARFGGVWACASLLHVPAGEAEQVLRGVLRTLVPGGAIFLSVQQGVGHEWRDGRWFQFYSIPQISEMLTRAGFIEVNVKADGERWINAHATRAVGRPAFARDLLAATEA
ncbi:class I SAM-dependent methyltransferase [Nonomuraea sp. NPDC004702]